MKTYDVSIYDRHSHRTFVIRIMGYNSGDAKDKAFKQYNMNDYKIMSVSESL